MIKKRLIVSAMTVLTLLSACAPILANADVIKQDTATVQKNDVTKTLNNESNNAQIIYKNPDGTTFTSNTVIPQTKSMSASPIIVGILWKYTTKSDGTIMRNTFRKCATAEGAVGVAAALAAAGFELGPIDAVLAAIVGVGTFAFHGRFTEAANLINAHPNSGKIYMYLDHCTYSAR